MLDASALKRVSPSWRIALLIFTYKGELEIIRGIHTDVRETLLPITILHLNVRKIL